MLGNGRRAIGSVQWSWEDLPESLACDLIEPLPPRIDLWIETLFRERILRVEHFSTDADGACLLGKAGRSVLYGALEDRMLVWSRWLRRLARDMAIGLDLQPAPAFDDAEMSAT